MGKYEDIHMNLPALFRPGLDDGSLITTFIQSVGGLLDDLNKDMITVMQSHWSGFADDAKFNDYVLLDRQQRELGPLNIKIETDRLAWETFPHVRDLARLGVLLALPPYRDPANLKESVEAYRTRLERYIHLYCNGLGTVHSLRSAVEMELPADVTVSTPQRERSFSIEEFAPLTSETKGFESRRTAADQVADEIGPMMRWTFSNTGFAAAPMTAYIQGITPLPDKKDPTRNPMVERYKMKAEDAPLAIAYTGEIPPDETLRLRPAFQSWLGMDTGIVAANALPDGEIPADPTAPGPWNPVAGCPEAGVTALLQSYDKVIWTAVENDDNSALWRFDGVAWQQVLDSTTLPEIHCMAEHDGQLWLGTASGLWQVGLYSEEGDAFEGGEHGSFTGMAVHCMLKDRDGLWWIGTGGGLYTLDASDDTMSLIAALDGTPVYAAHQDANGLFYFGGELGLFQYQPEVGTWLWYHGEEESDQYSEWEPLEPGHLPAGENVFLPPVRAIHVSLDASVWIGTDAGFARYYAKRVSGSTYKTMLSAFPDLNISRVSKIIEDSRGLIWFVTDRGLFRYDGRDLAQYQSGSWVSMGSVHNLYEENSVLDRDAWRYNRSGAPVWQAFDRYLSQWRPYKTAPRSAEAGGAHDLIWTDSIFPELGTLSGEAETFTPNESGHPTRDQFVMRVKPTEDRIVTGGLPAVPRMPEGTSTWRYLSMETEDMVISSRRPWWSREGRLFEDKLRDAPFPGRHAVDFPTGSKDWFGEVVFAYKPAAKLWFEWAPKQLRTTLVRLRKRSATESIPPAVLDRVWQGIQRVRPAGVRVVLAVENEIVRGGEI